MKDKYKNYYGHPKFYKIIEELAELHSKKNKQYATKDDPLGNFKRCGDMMKVMYKDNIPPELGVLLNYMSKQWDGVLQMVAYSKKDCPDELTDKLRDIAIYAIIGMIISEESKLEESLKGE